MTHVRKADANIPIQVMIDVRLYALAVEHRGKREVDRFCSECLTDGLTEWINKKKLKP